MKKLSAIIIDTYHDKTLVNIAIQMVKKITLVKNIFLLSDHPSNVLCEFVKIDTIHSQNHYGHQIFEKLIELPLEDHFLIFQWDGFPLHEENWRDYFCNYDYIGSPHGDWVGNGGFSLRSKKLLHTLKNLNITVDLSNPQMQLEDQIICTDNRGLLIQNGINFAPIEIAKQFSYDDGVLTKDIFGFHGPKNFPYYFNEDELIYIADYLIDRITHPNTMYKFLLMVIMTKKERLLTYLLNNFKSKKNINNLYDILRNNYPDNNLLPIFYKHGKI